MKLISMVLYVIRRKNIGKLRFIESNKITSRRLAE